MAIIWTVFILLTTAAFPMPDDLREICEQIPGAELRTSEAMMMVNGKPLPLGVAQCFIPEPEDLEPDV